MPRPVSFEAAKAAFVHRYTMEHIPQWATRRADNGHYYAPQFRTDREWYDSTLFHGESDLASERYCYTGGATWPLGQWLDSPFKR